jgi:23S rRNA pseudouridine1911/1915/1917 synthase
VDLLAYLSGRLGLSRRKAKDLLDRRNVLVNGKRVWMAGHALRGGDVLEVATGTATTPVVNRAIVLLDTDDYIVVNKPAGILTNGPGSLEQKLREVLQLPTLLAAHRLDRDTSGCLLCSKDGAAQERIIEVFARRAVSKSYRAIACGRLAEREMRIARPIDGQEAVTELRVLDAGPAASHLQCRLVTGRTHQIRRHLQAIGHAVLGDKQYGPSPRQLPGLPRVERQMLHSASVRFTHPRTGATVAAEAPVPADFRSCLKQLNLR